MAMIRNVCVDAASARVTAGLVLAAGIGLLAGCGDSARVDVQSNPAVASPDSETAACDDGIDPASRLLRSGFAVNAANTANQDSAIRASNVSALVPDFVHVAEGTSEKRGAPAMTEQAIFLSAGRRIVAIDRRSGCQYWSHSVALEPEGLTLRDNFLRSASVLYEPSRNGRPSVVVAADNFGHVHVLDARDGTPLWSRFVGTEAGAHRVTGGMQIHDGQLLVPMSSQEVARVSVDLVTPCCTTHGLLNSLDLYSGALQWRYHTTESARFNAVTRQFAPSGAAIWSTPTVDAARNRVYIGTGQNFSRPATDASDAIIALTLDSGEPIWRFQSTAEDAWNVSCESAIGSLLQCAPPAGPDLDFGAPPILATLPGGGSTLIAGAKNGVVYSLNPDNGALRWSRRIGRGGGLGGIHWGMAVDDHRVFAAVSDVTIDKEQVLRSDLIDLGVGASLSPVSGATPGIYALDMRSGELLWSQHPRHEHEGVMVDSIHSAAISVTNDLLFAGSLDGVLRALRVSDGEQLWAFDSAIAVDGVNGVAGNGGEIASVAPVIAGDTLLLNSGYDTFGGPDAYKAGAGNALFAFRLPR